MNFIEHLTAPTIGFYCLDIAPFDVEMFHEQIICSINWMFLYIDFMMLLLLMIINQIREII